MSKLLPFPIQSFAESFSQELKEKCIDGLESGNVLFFPKLDFTVSEKELSFFSESLVTQDRKNVSFDLSKDEIKGCIGGLEAIESIHEMMKRYAKSSNDFVLRLFPEYRGHLKLARTSFRPVEIQGRKSPSYRKDDTLLHLDSFPATPTKGNRILRLFTNVNPNGKPRVWKVGESCEEVLKKFAPKVAKPLPFGRNLLALLGITKSYRILYDHYMLGIHNKMKADRKYQEAVSQELIEFPANSSWMVFTDQVSHAALSGQYVLEQSFYLSVEGQKDEKKSPLKMLENILAMKMTV